MGNVKKIENFLVLKVNFHTVSENLQNTNDLSFIILYNFSALYVVKDSRNGIKKIPYGFFLNCSSNKLEKDNRILIFFSKSRTQRIPSRSSIQVPTGLDVESGKNRYDSRKAFSLNYFVLTQRSFE